MITLNQPRISVANTKRKKILIVSARLSPSACFHTPMIRHTSHHYNDCAHRALTIDRLIGMARESLDHTR